MAETEKQTREDLRNSHTQNDKKVEDLRERAEKKLKSTGTNMTEMLDKEVNRIVHDLEVHQVELEMQNEELRKTQQQLEASNAKYTDLYDLAPVGYFTCNRKGLILEANLTAAIQLAIAGESLLSTEFHDYITGEDQDKFYLYLKKTFKTKTRQTCEIRLKKKDGREFHAHLEGIVVQDKSEKFSQCRIAISDISELKRTEETLKESEEKYSTLVEQAKDGVGIAQDGVFKFVNKAMTDITGYSNEEILGMSFFDLVVPEHKDKIAQYSRQRLEGKDAPSLYESRILCKDGIVKYVESFGAAIRYKGRAANMGMIHDITERKRAEEELRESEAKYKILFESAGDALFIMSVSEEQRTRFVDCNSRTLTLFGCTELNQIIGKQPEDFSPLTQPDGSSSREKARQLIIKVMDGNPQLFEWKHHRLDGTPFFVEVVLNRIDLRGVPHMQALVRDITERKQAQEEQKKLQDQLYRSSRLSAVGQLSSGVAHEFNNLLSVILGHTQLSEEEDSISDIKHSLQIIKKTAMQGSKLVKKLGAFAKPKNPDFIIQDISDVINELMTLEEKQLNLENITIEKEFNNYSKVSCDWGQMEQVFINLLINATHAIKPKHKGTILISIRDVDSHVEIKFSDTGIGMDEETKEKIFDPFFSTKGSCSTNGLRIPGTGLGLSISHTIIEQHNGTITVESSQGAGTTFIIRLPAAEAGLVTEKTSEPEKNDSIVNDINELKVLLVDDEADLVELFELIFRKAGFKNYCMVNSGKQAIKSFKSFRPDLVILDIMMPDMNGEQVFDEIRSIDMSVPIVFITGKMDIEKKKYIEMDAYDFLKKPFEINDLLNVIKSIAK